jgi:DNA-binding NarL/FixJ family response regulator
MDVIQTLLVDDHALFAETLAARLGREPDIDVLPLAADLSQARNLIRAYQPAVVVLDLMLGTENGLNLLDELATDHRAARVLVLTGVSARDQLLEAVRRGVCGWLPKTVDGDHLTHVIRRVARGEYWIPPEMLGYVLRQLVTAEPVGPTDALAVLTPREREVLQCALDGRSKLEIARRLFVSPNTVRTHTHNLLGKLAVHTMPQAVALARRCGMRPSGE